MRFMKCAGAAVSLVCMLLIPQACLAAQAKVIKVDASVNTTKCPQYLAFQEMKKFIEDKSGGRYRVDIYDSGKLGSPASVLQGLKMGTVHIAMESAANVSSFLPVLGVLDAPFLFKNADEADMVLVDGPLGPRLLEPLRKIGIRPIGFAPSAFRWLLMKEPLTSPADIKGQKIRATASKIDRDNLKAMGFSPAAVTGGEMVSALQQGILDGVALPADSVPTEKSVAEVAPYAMDTEHCYMASVLVCSDRWFKSLPREDQGLMLEAMRHMIRTHGKMTKEVASFDSIRNSGIFREVIAITPEMKEYLVEKTAGVYETFPEDWQRIVEEIRATVKNAGQNQAS